MIQTRTPLETAFAEACLRLDYISSDDVTDNGRIALDNNHGVNGEQNGIGALFRKHKAAGHIVATGRFIRSQAPRRKGGAIQVWRVTEAGLLWAQHYLEHT